MTPASCLLKDKKAFIILKASQGNKTIQLYWFVYVAAVVSVSHLNGFYCRIRICMEVTAVLVAVPAEVNPVQLPGKMLTFGLVQGSPSA